MDSASWYHLGSMVDYVNRARIVGKVKFADDDNGDNGQPPQPRTLAYFVYRPSLIIRRLTQTCDSHVDCQPPPPPMQLGQEQDQDPPRDEPMQDIDIHSEDGDDDDDDERPQRLAPINELDERQEQEEPSVVPTHLQDVDDAMIHLQNVVSIHRQRHNQSLTTIRQLESEMSVLRIRERVYTRLLTDLTNRTYLSDTTVMRPFRSIARLFLRMVRLENVRTRLTEEIQRLSSLTTLPT
jgi:hypothetical protein